MLISEDLELVQGNKIGGVYQIKNVENNKIYIGSTKNFYKRWMQHINKLINNKHCNRYLQNSFNKYGEDNFDFSILETVSNENDLINREQYWIDLLNPIDSKIGYNILPNAGRTAGVKRSKETKRKLSESKMGDKNPMYNKEVSEETRKRLSEALLNMPEDKKKEMIRKRGEKLSISLKGRKLSKESKQKMRERKLGKKLSEEQKLKIKENNSINVVQVDLKGNFIKDWNSMIDVKRELGYDCGTVSKCCRKINKTYKGFLWFFADEYYSNDFDIEFYTNRRRRDYSIKCSVIQIDKNTQEIIKIWDDINEAVEQLDIKKDNILACCRGKYKSSKGFIWNFNNVA